MLKLDSNHWELASWVPSSFLQVLHSSLIFWHLKACFCSTARFTESAANLRFADTRARDSVCFASNASLKFMSKSTCLHCLIPWFEFQYSLHGVLGNMRPKPCIWSSAAQTMTDSACKANLCRDCWRQSQAHYKLRKVYRHSLLVSPSSQQEQPITQSVSISPPP